SLNGIACLSTTNCYVVGAIVSGNKIHYLVTTDGSSWTNKPATNNTNNNSLNGITCPSTTTCYTVGGGGTILNGTTSVGNSTWTSQTSGTTSDFNGIACRRTTTCFAVGAGGTIR